MATDEARAIDAVRARLTELSWPQARLQETAGLAEATVRDFLTGRRWPRDQTLHKIEEAISWPRGTIAHIAEGGDIPSVDVPRRFDALGQQITTMGEASELRSIVLSMPPGWREGLSDLEAAEIEAAVKLEALRLARELRANRARREEATQ